MLFVSVYRSSVSIQSSRPNPDCLYPPNGVPGNAENGQLTMTIPARIAPPTRLIRASFVDHIAEPSHTLYHLLALSLLFPL